MTARPTTILTTRTALCLALGAVLLASSLPARAGDGDSDDSVPIDTQVMRGIMSGLGLKRDGEAGIDYSERAPLVIPAKRALPPPENSSAAIAKNPAWPNDPDIKRAKQEAAEARNRPNADEQLRLDESALRPEQMTPGRKPARVTHRSDDGYRPSPNGSGSQISPKQLGDRGNWFSNMFAKDEPDTASFTGEAPRTALTEPPPGYQTPSPDQPYGAGKKEKQAAPTTIDYLRDHPAGMQ